ncbi:MAG: hypothetical protein HUK25_00250, partial [Treponema sp.]|nr:hypothetical protein [Treponema sp.]
MKKNESAKEIKEVKKETPAKKTKAKKAPKMVLQSKLPGLLKKTYTEKKLEKKLLRHIYIPSDLELVKSVFETKEDEKGNILYFVDRKKEIEKSKAGTLKKIIKQVKAQKPGIKIVSLVAVVVFIAAVGITITTFKNIVVKKIIVSSLQGIFHAETDIQKVDVQIFGSSLLIEKLEQTNKDNPVKNIFEIDRISLDFNLTDLLKGKFHAEELAVEGVALDTDRKKEGKVFPKKDKAEKEKENKLNLAMQNLSASAVDKLTQMFAAYNPEKMISDIQSELKSPA